MQPLVIKVGGAFIGDKDAARGLFAVIAQLIKTRPVILVHGGGPIVEQWMQALNLKSTKIDGLRVTTDVHMPYVVGALAGTANTQLVAQARACGLEPVGLSLADAHLVHCTQMQAKYGAVGNVEPADAKLLNTLLAQGFLPIISSISCSDGGQLLNINADQAATAVAQLLKAELVMLSDVVGVLDKQQSLLAQLSPRQIELLAEQKVIRDGMLVKVKAALNAANSIGLPVTIASWKNPQSLLQMLAGNSAGTRIYPADVQIADETKLDQEHP
ncbi:acetylglutamate kinase [Lacimicrobium alkaliphilum]|uniref:Acetylglutamate kinase n=1 Tax=Lacimicrobium alkaliphilum TaxID=1526571 RepID=A0ABQ1RLA7_9ALTE|nr:acetylglutamate kinase [Lacimicrobium alkaliphilum]GGD73703.1 acetylglutamate kinase [Lacimicrobium alkaliphilum]